ncbi:MAG: retroviral-like aspartic protease family protein [Lachnospiraceae bacterium]|nr:retroviral-like aspartic protease family protein [Lachnospiraceae bacterium]
MFIKNDKRNYSACFDGVTNVLVCEVAVEVYLNGKLIVRNLKGFWDTGSSNSAISIKVAKEMGLPIYKANKRATSIIGNKNFNSYNINVYLNNQMCFENIEAVGNDMNGIDYEFVIGMDIIQQGNLIVKNRKYTTIRFKK